MKEQASQNNNGEPKDDQQEIRKRRRGRKRSSKAEAQETSLGTNKDLTLNLKNSSSRIQQQKQHLDEKPKKKRKKVSQEALSLSSELKELSQKKLMRQALDLYWEPKYEKVRDGFHACIVIDCCARCGDMSEAERIIKEVKRTGRIVNVETKTALIKGYSHNGDMPRAAQIFEQMCQEKNPEQQPNVRTLNTFLRGCLWTAAVVSNKDQIVGGVTSAERTWKLFQNLTEKKDVQTDSDSIKSVDISSYEYLISLLCQALRIDDATKRIKELKDAYGISFRKNSFLGGDHTVLETLAVSYLGLGRAHALLGHKKDGLEACKFARNAIHKSREMLATDHSRGGGYYSVGRVTIHVFHRLALTLFRYYSLAFPCGRKKSLENDGGY